MVNFRFLMLIGLVISLPKASADYITVINPYTGELQLVQNVTGLNGKLLNVTAGSNITITWSGCPNNCVAQINSSGGGGGITVESDPLWSANYSTFLTHVSNATVDKNLSNYSNTQNWVNNNTVDKNLSNYSNTPNFVSNSTMDKNYSNLTNIPSDFPNSTSLKSILGTLNRINISGGNTIDIATSWIGQVAITTLGTITTGTWQGSVIADAYIANVSNLFGKSTTNLSEGTNLYYTNARARAAISNGSSTNLTWNSTTGMFDLNFGTGCTATNNFFRIAGTDANNLSCQAVSFTGYAPLASPTFTGTVTIPTPFTIGAISMTATGTELNYVAGVTSAIQTQLNSKGNANLPIDINLSSQMNTTSHNNSGSNNYCATCHIYLQTSKLNSTVDKNTSNYSFASSSSHPAMQCGVGCHAAVTNSTVNINVSNATGNLSTSRLNGGTGATSSTYWRGDGTWNTPASGGGSSATTPTTILLYSSRLSTGVTKPGPLTELDAPYSRTPVNLTGFSNMRVYFVDSCSASTANAQVGVDYSTNWGTSWTNILAFNHTCNVVAYFNQTTYTAIPAGAKADVLLRAVIDPATTMTVTQVGVEIN